MNKFVQELMKEMERNGKELREILSKKSADYTEKHGLPMDARKKKGDEQ